MEFGRRKTQKYTFKDPKIDELRGLISEIPSFEDFRKKYGAIIPLMKLKMKDGLMATLVQFYDPLYHCFTFPDYQLMPTLEEYSYLIDRPIIDCVPFNGLEVEPKAHEIAAILHLKKSEVEANMTTKGKIRGLPAQFLLKKARYFADMKSMEAFEAVFALLAYGLFLFPNVDNFVDINAIRIIMIGNPAPTLLAETYYSIHLRNSYQGGMIICCVPLLYRWFISHLPTSLAFWDLKKQPRWAPKIMALTHSDIIWYHQCYYDVEIIDSCGSFPNVPLLGTKGCISYNPIPARRQLGYPLRDKPKGIYVSGFFLKEDEDQKAFRKDVETSWCHMHKKGRQDLGPMGAVSLEPYLEWVQARSIQLKMPYPREEPLADLFVSTTSQPGTREELQLALIKMEQEKEAWKNKYQTLQMLHTSEMRNKENLIEQLWEQGDSWSHNVQQLSHVQDFSFIHLESDAWKAIIDKYALAEESSQDEARTLKRKRQHGDGSSSDLFA